MYAFGSTIDWWTNASSGWCACRAYETSLSRSGPTVPVALAALSVWQLEQLFWLKTARPAAEGEIGVVEDPVVVVDWVVDGGAGAADFSCCRSQVSNAAGSITIAWVRMSEWPRPQSSVHSSGNVPSRVGVMWSVVTSPGTMSSFCENCGTKTEWITSSERM